MARTTGFRPVNRSSILLRRTTCMKITKKSERTRHPWGDDDYHSTVHARWLVEKILRKINKKINESGKSAKVHVTIENDLSHWKEAENMIRHELETSGWSVTFNWDAECGQHLIVLE